MSQREYGDMAEYERLNRQLIGHLDGRVLELGVGRGANLALLPRGVEWVGLEPSRRQRRHLADERVLAGRAEQIPLPNDSVDAVLGTIVLCSVDSQERALDEVQRVLRPGGRFVFFEHVAAPDGTWRHRGQRLIAPANRLLDRGCDPSRETWRLLEAATFRTLELHWFASGTRRRIGGFAVA